MRIAILTLAGGLMIAASANAACYGTGAYSTCSDSSGNNYSIQRYGNTTIMNGSNSRTGSTWNQTSRTFGNTTYNSGRSSDGGMWNTTRQDYGNGNFTINGRDSNGNTVNKSCFFGSCR